MGKPRGPAGSCAANSQTKESHRQCAFRSNGANASPEPIRSGCCGKSGTELFAMDGGSEARSSLHSKRDHPAVITPRLAAFMDERRAFAESQGGCPFWSHVPEIDWIAANDCGEAAIRDDCSQTAWAGCAYEIGASAGSSKVTSSHADLSISRVRSNWLLSW